VNLLWLVNETLSIAFGCKTPRLGEIIASPTVARAVSCAWFFQHHFPGHYAVGVKYYAHTREQRRKSPILRAQKYNRLASNARCKRSVDWLPLNNFWPFFTDERGHAAFACSLFPVVRSAEPELITSLVSWPPVANSTTVRSNRGSINIPWSMRLMTVSCLNLWCKRANHKYTVCAHLRFWCY